MARGKMRFRPREHSTFFEKVRVESQLPTDSRILFVPLNDEEQRSWAEFRELDIRNTEIGEQSVKLIENAKKSVDLNHPVVPVVGNFAVAAFNELCALSFKKGVYENVSEVEFTEFKYVSTGIHEVSYIFYITLEAIEEGIHGVYIARVACLRDGGMRSLLKFVRTMRQPVGKMAIAATPLYCANSRYKVMKGLKKDIKMDLKMTNRITKSKKRAKKAAKLIFLNKQYEAVKGACCNLYREIQRLTPTTWNKTFNPDDWSIPHNLIIGLNLRSDEQMCRGYDYCNMSEEFSLHMMCCAGDPFPDSRLAGTLCAPGGFLVFVSSVM